MEIVRSSGVLHSSCSGSVDKFANHLGGFFLNDFFGHFLSDVVRVPWAFSSDGLLDLGGNFTDWDSDDLDLFASTVVEGRDGGVFKLLLSKLQVSLSSSGQGESFISVLLFENLLDLCDDISGLGEFILNHDLFVRVEILLDLDDFIDREEVSDGNVDYWGDGCFDEGLSTVSANYSLKGGLDTLFSKCLLN